MIRKEGDYWYVRSHDGRNLGRYKTKAAAQKRLKQVEYFKHKNKK